MQEGWSTATPEMRARGFGAGRGFPVEFTIQGPDWDRLGELSERIKGELAKTGLMVDIDTDENVATNAAAIRDAIAAALTSRTRAILVNTPHNPSATVWTSDVRLKGAFLPSK